MITAAKKIPIPHKTRVKRNPKVIACKVNKPTITKDKIK